MGDSRRADRLYPSNPTILVDETKDENLGWVLSIWRKYLVLFFLRKPYATSAHHDYQFSNGGDKRAMVLTPEAYAMNSIGYGKMRG